MQSQREFSVQSLLQQRDFVRALALRLTQDGEEARDVEQDTWLSALERGPKPVADARLWLAGVARRLAFSRRRSESRRQLREREREREAVKPRSSGGIEATERLMVSLLQLEDRYRLPLMMRFFDGQSVHQIAESLELPFETVRTRLRRGLDLLRSDLDREFGGRQAWAIGFASLGTRAATKYNWPVPVLIATSAAAFVGLLVWVETPEPSFGSGALQSSATTLQSAGEQDPLQRAGLPTLVGTPAQAPTDPKAVGRRAGESRSEPALALAGGNFDTREHAVDGQSQREAVGRSDAFPDAADAYWRAVAAAREGAARYVPSEQLPAEDAAVLDVLLGRELEGVEWPEGMSLSQILALLERQSGVSIRLDPQSEPSQLAQLALPALHLPHPIRLDPCLAWVQRESGHEWTWWVESGTVFVGSIEEERTRSMRFEHSAWDFFIKASDYFPDGADFHPIFDGRLNPRLLLMWESAANGSWGRGDKIEAGGLVLHRSMLGHLRAQRLIDHLRDFFVPKRWERLPGSTRNYYRGGAASESLLMQMERARFPYAGSEGDSSLGGLAQRLQSALGANVLATRLLMEEYEQVGPSEPLTKELSVREALDRMQAQEPDFRWQVEADALVLYNACEAPSVAFALYDLREILGRGTLHAEQLARDWPRLAAGLKQGDVLGGDMLVEFIQAEISSRSWDESPSYSMALMEAERVLYAVQHPAALAQIHNLIESLRAIAKQSDSEYAGR